LFASFLGYNPMATLLGPQTLHALPAGQASTITGRSFFPQLISGPFHTALVYAFVFAIAACLVAVVASLLRGGKYHHVEPEARPVGQAQDAVVPAAAPTGSEPVEPGGPATSPAPA
jgi:hypothetical protein